MLEDTINCHDFRVSSGYQAFTKPIQSFPIGVRAFPDNTDRGSYAKENVLGLLHSAVGHSRFLSIADLGSSSDTSDRIRILVGSLS